MSMPRFSGALPAPYPGAARDGCLPTHPDAVSWHVSINGSHWNMGSFEDFKQLTGNMLQHAYAAGVADARDEMRKSLGL